MLCAGKTVTAAIAVIEEGHATYVSGELNWAQVVRHLSKFDYAVGCYRREYERLRTETYLEEMHTSGIQTGLLPRHFERDLTVKLSTRLAIVEDSLRLFLRNRGYTVEKHRTPLNIKHLERMRHRTGYIKKGEFEDGIH